MADKRFIRSEDVRTIEYDWGRSKWLCSKECCNAENFSANIVVVEPGKGHLMHNHPGVEEFLYFIAGEASQTIGSEQETVGPGDMVHIPPDVYHETLNIGWAPLVFLAVYSEAAM